jgi:hypothetical protein
MGDSIWMMRLPESVAQEFSALDTGEQAGLLERTAEGRLHIRLMSGDVFKLEEMKGGPQQLSFVVDEAQKSFKYKGAVTKKMSLEPMDVDKFREETRRRALQADARPQHTA